MAYDLEFEKPLAELEKKINVLQRKGDRIRSDELRQLQEAERDLQRRTEEIYRDLTTWQMVQVARHKDRPYTADYIRLICDDFFELHGDRAFSDDHAIMAGPALIDGTRVMLIGHQKGRDLKEKQFRNLGMPHPDGYRKAERLLQQAERFRMPVVCLIDTAGASIALPDEERGQSEAIASILYVMSRTRTPIISVIIGEGGSGGALAIGIADRMLMLQYSIYSVASPEAAASIIWRDSAYGQYAANSMRISAREVFELGLINEVLPEPVGGAHRNYHQTANTLKDSVLKHLAELKQISLDELLEKRYQKFRSVGEYSTVSKMQAANITI
jgi:acetyl-CoA carboxylase carboxyl transferase subunit alpha